MMHAERSRSRLGEYTVIYYVWTEEAGRNASFEDPENYRSMILEKSCLAPRPLCRTARLKIRSRAVSAGSRGRSKRVVSVGGIFAKADLNSCCGNERSSVAVVLRRTDGRRELVGSGEEFQPSHACPLGAQGRCLEVQILRTLKRIYHPFRRLLVRSFEKGKVGE